MGKISNASLAVPTYDNNGGMMSEEEGVVPDNYSRPVSPNFSPKEDLTQLGSPIKKNMKSSGSAAGRRSSALMALAQVLNREDY